MKKIITLVAVVCVLPIVTFCADYDLGNLAKTGRLELFNRTLDQTKADSSESVFLNSAANDGLAWVPDLEFSDGTVELEIKGTNRPGQSFVGLAFHGKDDRTFDAVYLRPFNFQAAEPDRRNHSIQYISMPEHDWSDLRNRFPGKYETNISPAPEPGSWVKLRLTIQNKRISAFVNNSPKPVLTIELLNDRSSGKLGLWVGNGSDGWFRNLKVTPSLK